METINQGDIVTINEPFKIFENYNPDGKLIPNPFGFGFNMVGDITLIEEQNEIMIIPIKNCELIIPKSSPEKLLEVKQRDDEILDKIAQALDNGGGLILIRKEKIKEEIRIKKSARDYIRKNINHANIKTKTKHIDPSNKEFDDKIDGICSVTLLSEDIKRNPNEYILRIERWGFKIEQPEQYKGPNKPKAERSRKLKEDEYHKKLLNLVLLSNILVLIDNYVNYLEECIKNLESNPAYLSDQYCGNDICEDMCLCIKRDGKLQKNVKLIKNKYSCIDDEFYKGYENIYLFRDKYSSAIVRDGSLYKHSATHILCQGRDGIWNIFHGTETRDDNTIPKLTVANIFKCS
jgi:hypothetical protein